MSSGVSLLKIRKGERWLAILLVIWIILLQWLIISRYFDIFSVYKNSAFGPFPRNFNVSGFDALIYSITTNWGGFYTIIMRHPLLIFLLYPLHLVNWLLLEITGMNCVQFVIGSVLTFCGVYSGIFIRRIIRYVIRLSSFDSALITFLTFSFAYIPLSFIVPDHFGFTMLLLTYTLLITGLRMKGVGGKRSISTIESAVLITLTAGVTMTNGVKTIISSFFVNGKSFFRWKHLLFGAILPMVLLWQITGWEYRYIVRPGEIERAEAKAKIRERKKKAETEKKVAQERQQDSIAKTLSMTTKSEKGQTTTEKRPNDKVKEPLPQHKRAPLTKSGKPINNGTFLKWSDISTSRWETLKDNLFGESIQLHDSHLLEDVNRKRPVFVKYNYLINDIVEVAVILLFIYGIWRGRRQRFLWLMLFWASFDMVLHLGFGFGINEVYIMSAHWLFIISITIGYTLKERGTKCPILYSLRTIIVLITLFLTIYNQYQLITFLST